jgi:hypothetical protein
MLEEFFFVTILYSVPHFEAVSTYQIIRDNKDDMWWYCLCCSHHKACKVPRQLDHS